MLANVFQSAANAVEQTDGHKLDKNHVFSVCRFSEFSRIVEVEDKYTPPPPPQYKERGTATCHVSCVMCHASRVMCHVSCVCVICTVCTGSVMCVCTGVCDTGLRPCRLPSLSCAQLVPTFTKPTCKCTHTHTHTHTVTSTVEWNGYGESGGGVDDEGCSEAADRIRACQCSFCLCSSVVVARGRRRLTFHRLGAHMSIHPWPWGTCACAASRPRGKKTL